MTSASSTPGSRKNENLRSAADNDRFAADRLSGLGRQHEADEPVFGCRVGSDVPSTLKAGSRGDRDHDTRAAREHGRQCGPNQVVWAIEIGGDDTPPCVLVCVNEFL